MPPIDKSRNLYRGLLIPDGDIADIWEGESTIDEAGERAGIPVAASQTEMILESSGNQFDTGAAEKLEILSMRGGYPGAGEAGFAWTQAGGEDPQNYRGWDPPSLVSQYEVVDYDTNVTHHLNLDLISKTKEDGSDHLFGFYEFVSGSPGNIHVEVRRRDDNGWLGMPFPSSVDVTDQPAGSPDLFSHPTGVTLPSGRIVCFYIVYNEIHELANVRMKYSDDDAVTWRLGSKFCLREPVQLEPSTQEYVPKRMRCEYKDGQILLLIWFKVSVGGGNFNNVIWQYASDDLGATFYLISQFSGDDTDNSGGFPDIAVGSGTFVVAWIREGSARPVITRIGSAFEPLNAETLEMAVFGEPVSDADLTPGIGDLTICSDEDGTLYLFVFQNPLSSGALGSASCGCVYRSFEGGAFDTWAGMGMGWGAGSTPTALGTFYRPETRDAHASYIKPIDISASHHRGRIVVAHRFVGGNQQQEQAPAVGGGSFAVFYMGGFSQVVTPGVFGFKRDDLRAGFDSTWYPYTQPGTATGGMWALQTTGPPATFSGIIGPGRYRLAVAAGSTHYFEDTFVVGTVGLENVSFTEGLSGRFTCEVKQPAPNQQAVKIDVCDGFGNDVGITIFVEDTGIRILDSAGATLAAITPPMLDIKHQFFWGVRGVESGGVATSGEASVWYRLWDANEDRTWIEIYSGALPLAAGPATSRIQWGDANPLITSDVNWDEFNFSYGYIALSGLRYPNVGDQIAQGQQNPNDLFPRNYVPTPIYVDANTRIAAIDGPTFEGDTWDLTTRHLLGAENMIAGNSPSPSVTWRSKTAGAGDVIAFQRNPDAAGALPGNDLYAVHFENCNFKRAAIELKIGGVWTPVGTLELYREFEFQREGHTIRPNSSGGSIDGFYVEYNELKDCKFEFDPDGQSSIVSTIERNSEGVGYDMPGTPGVTKRATLFLDPDTFDEGAAPSTGTGAVWFRNVTALINLPFQSPFEGIRLILCPTGTLPPEGYYEAGNIIPGPVAVFGWDYSRERIVNREANTELITGRDGSRHAYIAGEPFRTVRFSWREGVDITELRTDYTATSTEGYVKTWNGGTSSPVAMRQDGPLLMDGLVDRLNGSAVPVVYIPRIEKSDDVMLFDPRQFNRGAVYGRIVSAHTRETALGTEETDEVYRVNTVTIEGER